MILLPITYNFYLHIFFLSSKRDKKRIRKDTDHTIGENSTTFLRVSAISFWYYYYSWICITDFSCYLLFVFRDLIFYDTKIQNSNIQSLLFRTRWERWTTALLEDQYNCCRWGWFIVVNWQVLVWLIFLWYGWHPVAEL